MDKRIKAQAAIEFTVLIAGVFLVFILFLKVIAGQYIDISQDKAYSALKDLTETIQIELFIAESSKEGYNRKFAIPTKINNNMDYNIILSNNELSLKTTKLQHTVNVPNVAGILQKGNNQIKKINGTIVLN
ncbi:hypothetical protein KY331_03810 [Candidatus Woesearchaeota archaeon]|nr:hypothetical protein [Candidatus Woesearchaeota archaeon]